MTLSPDLLVSWQGALAAEHAAVFGYQVLGPHLVGSEVAQARADESAHAALRDLTGSALVAAGHDPVGPLADYPLPFPISDGASARRLAVRLEDAAAAAWRYLLSVAVAVPPDGGSAGADPAGLRASAVSALVDSAVRGTRWRLVLTPDSPTVAFPGI